LLDTSGGRLVLDLLDIQTITMQNQNSKILFDELMNDSHSTALVGNNIKKTCPPVYHLQTYPYSIVVMLCWHVCNDRSSSCLPCCEDLARPVPNVSACKLSDNMHCSCGEAALHTGSNGSLTLFELFVCNCLFTPTHDS